LTILLFQSPLFSYLRARHCVPRGLLCLGTYLVRQGFDAHVVPLGFETPGSHGTGEPPGRQALVDAAASVLLDRVRRTGAEVVGCGPLTAEYPTALELLARVKQSFPGVITVMGGVHATYQVEEVLSNRYVDLVVRGEGEWTLTDVCERTSAGRGDWAGVPGLAWRDPGGNVVREQPRIPGPVHTLPSPDYGLLPEEFVREAWVPLMFSRGCPYKCSFCLETRFWPKPVRWRTQQAIERELDDLVECYGLRNLALQDSLFAHGRPEVAGVCRLLSKWRGKVDGYVHLRPDQGSDEIFRMLTETGVVRRVSFGLESASPAVLTQMGKPTDFTGARAAVERANAWDMTVHTLWIIGHPGDSPSGFRVSMRAMETLWARGLHQSMDLSYFYPYPGTPAWDDAERLGVRMLTTNWEDFGRGDVPVCELETFPAERQEELFLEAHRQARLFKEASTALRKII
jgi:radical SAM superfamily enzyme YgiQ (UPF0313 family)